MSELVKSKRIRSKKSVKPAISEMEVKMDAAELENGEITVISKPAQLSEQIGIEVSETGDYALNFDSEHKFLFVSFLEALYALLKSVEYLKGVHSGDDLTIALESLEIQKIAGDLTLSCSKVRNGRIELLSQFPVHPDGELVIWTKQERKDVRLFRKWNNPLIREMRIKPHSSVGLTELAQNGDE